MFSAFRRNINKIYNCSLKAIQREDYFNFDGEEKLREWTISERNDEGIMNWWTDVYKKYLFLRSFFFINVSLNNYSILDRLLWRDV